ncbi:MAG: tyrosine-type recombinase/integrase [Anaerolineae bacterium]|nr:tyrosine-type recombinase/integrase [Anaerolineae bacterium]
MIEKQILEKDPTMDFAIECRSLGAVQKKGNGEIILAQEEIGRLREKLKGINHPRSYRDLAIIELILETGILINALVGLNVADLDLRPEMGVLSSRAVGMSPLIIELAAPSFRQYLRLGRPEFAHNENEQALFISQLGGRMTRQGIWQLLGKWGAAAKLRTKLSPRILRNTAVYNMLTSGRSIVEIQQILGHRNPFSTSAYLRRVEKIASIEINK